MENLGDLKKKSGHPSNNQKKVMVEFLKSRPALIYNFTYKDAENLRVELGNILNSIPGAQKTWKNWRKTWQDLRSRTKCKLSDNKKKMRGTGGGPHEEEQMDPLEENILELIKPVSVEGHREVQESEVILNITGTDLENTKVDNKIESPVPSTSWGTPSSERKFSKRVPTRLKHTAAAAEKYSEYLERKLKMKQAYHEEKLQIMRASLEYKNKSSEALRKLAEAVHELI